MEINRSLYTTFSHEFEVQRHDDVSCNLCGGATYTLLGRELDRYEIRECASCRLVYVSPQPAAEELPRFYEGMYADTSDSSMAVRSAGAIEGHLQLLIAGRQPAGGKYLEIGCGAGHLLKKIAELPFELSAIELSEEAAGYARRAVPKAVITSTPIEEAEFPPQSQNCIAMIAVLEHVKDPAAILARLTGWLAPGGTVAILVPYIQGYMRVKRFLPWLPIHFEAPRHLFDFSPRTLSHYLSNLGYEDIRFEIGRPYSANGPIDLALIWTVKLIGLAVFALSGRRYIYPFAGSIVACANKPFRSARPG
ncbi:MAG: class I SAM-dependent methyltransferase [Candidatus Hydrogenedentota bacterium]